MATRVKETGEKIAAAIKAWDDLRKNKSFAGKTLAEFKAAIKPSLDARAAILTLKNQLIAAVHQRKSADAASLKELRFLVNAVKGDPAEGEDGELYEAMGYVRLSERKSGKTNTPKKAAPAS